MASTISTCRKVLFGVVGVVFSVSLSADVIFQTDFAGDASFSATKQQSWQDVVSNAPLGFSGALVEGNGRVYGAPGEGVNGSVAMKFEWDPALGQPVSQLMLHLTDDISTGYDEIYVRYNLRLPNNFKVGIPGVESIPYWKFGRLWQNTDVEAGKSWTENREDSGYAVWNFGGDEKWGVDAAATFAANTGSNLYKGSAGGERYMNDFYIGVGDYATHPGHFNAVGGGAWDFDPVTRFLRNNDQVWHTIEWRFKLASSDTANDGVFQMWFDGVEQAPSKISGKSGAPALADLEPNEIPTSKIGSGYNFLVIFDNMTKWSGDWDEESVGNGIYVNDVVVSTNRIGHGYKVSGIKHVAAVSPSLPNPPSGLRIEARSN